MSRQISADSAEWTEDDVLYLHQLDQRMDEVKEAAERLSIELPGPSGVEAPVKVGVPAPGQNCPTCGQVVPEPPDPGEQLSGEGGTGEYDSWTKTELQTELDARGIAYGSGDTKAELIALLVADDG